ncbi:thioesterase family protein [Pseudomaricurvus sp. HS19]|uniref:acyl-CoA thioesterase n=1 Tax=Pseudomaricurvus sp. HS19 TaxID=2692626 RepID=UPI00136BACD7|nr:thioesterase family protein [Pseudomaricurvus sp. HS19]MYM63979.1 acyl-CoA thioesterase [Pseudomaricurvus sp. HS19]
MISAEIEVTVPFHDIDVMEIAWHGHYSKYFEIARCALFDKLDYSHIVMRETGYLWPVIDLHIRYVKPALFQQRLKVRATLTEWENRMKIDYRITDADSGARLTKGHTIQVAVEAGSHELCFVSPDVFLEKVAKATAAESAQ